MSTPTRAVLIVHGLSATPATMAPTMEALEDAGYHVLAPLLPGHGTTELELAATPWQAWARCVQDAYDQLAEQYNDIYYIGLSLGALLGLQLAESVKLRALALLATPLHMSRYVRNLVPLVRYSPARWLYHFSTKDWSHSVADPEGRRAYQESSYGRIPVQSVYQIHDLQKVVRANLHKIHSPILLVHSHLDQVAPPSNVHDLCAAITNPTPDVLWLEKSEHVITLDLERDLMNARIVEFFERTQP